MKIRPPRLKARERRILESWANEPDTDYRLRLRARIVLGLAEGRSLSEVGAALGIRMATASKWRRRFEHEGIRGLKDAPRSGKPPKYGESTEERVLYLLTQAPPKGFKRWSGRLLARALRNVSKDQIWRILRKRGIRLGRASAGQRRSPFESVGKKEFDIC